MGQSDWHSQTGGVQWVRLERRQDQHDTQIHSPHKACEALTTAPWEAREIFPEGLMWSCLHCRETGHSVHIMEMDHGKSRVDTVHQTMPALWAGRLCPCCWNVGK